VRRYFGRKLLTYSITFFVAATIDWLIPRFMPGDPVASLVSRTNGISPESAKALYDYYNNLFGLNQPLPVQYLNFWIALLHGNLGLSVYGHGTSVTEMIMAAVPYTLALLIPAILLSWWAGNSFGALAARRKWLDSTVLPVGYILTATPYMWLALVLSFLLAFSWRIFPLSGGYGFNLEPTLTWLFFTDLVAHWVLPFLSLFHVMFGGWAIGMRNMIIYELESDYSRYLEVLGAPQSLVRKYAFRNAMLPQITGLALQLGVIIGGQLVTEIVFSYPGLGHLVFAAIQSADYFLLQGIFLFIIVGVLVANFIVDIVYVIVDPRVRVSMTGGTA
jgi:peptide/nickel transport system permease protein